MTPGRILINGSYAPSVMNFRAPLILDLLAKGYAVHVSVPAVTALQRAEIEATGAVLHEVPLDRSGTGISSDLRYFTAMRRLIRSIRPQLVLGYTIKPNIWGSLAAKAEGVRSASMITGLGYTFLHARGGRHRLISSLSRVLYRCAAAANDIVIFQNPDDMRDFIAAGCLRDESKARLVAGSGVNVDHFVPEPLPEAPVFLMVARLLKAKGVGEYARAAIDLIEGGSDARFMLVGPFDPAPDSIDPRDLDGWQERGIEYLGFCEDVREPMREASVFVLPSYREGTPRTVLEASAMGRPTITTDAPGCRETVIDRKTGLLVPVADVDALRDAMRRLAGDPQLRAAMGEEARRFCAGKYAVDKVNQSLMEHLKL